MFSLLRSIAAVAVAAAVLAPTAVADDLRSPDTRDRAEELRGPYDRRSPDTRDIAEGVKLGGIVVQTPPPLFLEEDGFDWIDAGIGAAVSVGAALVLLGSVSLAAGRRRRPVGA